MSEGNNVLKEAAVRILVIAGLIIAVSLIVFGLSAFNPLFPRFEFVANGITIAIGYAAFKAHRVRDGFAALLVWYVLLLGGIRFASALYKWGLFMEASYIVGLTAAIYLLFFALGKQVINGWIQRVIAATLIIGVAHGFMVIFLEIVSRRMFSHPIKTLEWSYTNLKTGIVIGLLAAGGMELAEYMIKLFLVQKEVVSNSKA